VGLRRIRTAKASVPIQDRKECRNISSIRSCGTGRKRVDVSCRRVILVSRYCFIFPPFTASTRQCPSPLKSINGWISLSRSTFPVSFS